MRLGHFQSELQGRGRRRGRGPGSGRNPGRGVARAVGVTRAGAWPACAERLSAPGPGAASCRAATHRDARVLLALVGGGHHGQVLDDLLGVFRFAGSRLASERHGNCDPGDKVFPWVPCAGQSVGVTAVPRGKTEAPRTGLTRPRTDACPEEAGKSADEKSGRENWVLLRRSKRRSVCDGLLLGRHSRCQTQKDRRKLSEKSMSRT